MRHPCELWIQEIASDQRRGWLLVRSDHYAADVARLPSAARLVSAGDSSMAEATNRLSKLLGGHPDYDENWGGLTLGAIDQLPFVEGPAGQPLLRDASHDIHMLLMECFAVPVRRALLYAENLPPRFFDVSSFEAGPVLQKLRTCGLRVAVVAALDSVPMNSAFFEWFAAERRDGVFGVFESRAAALHWLAAS